MQTYNPLVYLEVELASRHNTKDNLSKEINIDFHTKYVSVQTLIKLLYSLINCLNYLNRLLQLNVKMITLNQVAAVISMIGTCFGLSFHFLEQGIQNQGVKQWQSILLQIVVLFYTIVHQQCLFIKIRRFFYYEIQVWKHKKRSYGSQYVIKYIVYGSANYLRKLQLIWVINTSHNKSYYAPFVSWEMTMMKESLSDDVFPTKLERFAPILSKAQEGIAIDF